MKGWAVAAFIPPAHTNLYLAAYETEPDAPTLPLFCYTAAGWFNDTIYVTALRIEPDIRQEAAGYNDNEIANGANNLLSLFLSIYFLMFHLLAHASHMLSLE
jgi:hypothetical protein